MSLVQRDYILRLIEAIAAAIASIMRRKQSGDLVGGRLEVHNAVVQLLGPAAAMVTRLDSRTAANLVGDAPRLALWGRLKFEDSDLLRLMGRDADADASDVRALEILLESWSRAAHFDAETRVVFEAVRARVPAERLDATFRSVLASVPPAPPT